MEAIAEKAPEAGGKRVAAAFDLLGHRGALRVVWGLRKGPLTFRELATSAGLSPATLNARLAELRTAGLVAHERGYHLTPAGTALATALKPLRDWAKGRRLPPA